MMEHRGETASQVIRPVPRPGRSTAGRTVNRCASRGFDAGPLALDGGLERHDDAYERNPADGSRMRGDSRAESAAAARQLAGQARFEREGLMNRVVARYSDGHILKGETSDFLPNKELFHVIPTSQPGAKGPVAVKVGELKAVFFVKDLEGDPRHMERKSFDPARPPAGRKIRVVFMDGEVLLGTTQGYQPGRPGFFIVPADEGSNIERCYVVSASASSIDFV